MQFLILTDKLFVTPHKKNRESRCQFSELKNLKKQTYIMSSTSHALYVFVVTINLISIALYAGTSLFILFA